MANKILFVQFTNPGAYPPLQHAARIFKNNGWIINFLALQRPGTAKIIFESVSEEYFYWVRHSDKRLLMRLNYFLFCLKALILVASQKVDWVYGSDHWSLPILYFSKIIFKKRIIYHEHDSPDSAKGFLLNQILKFRLKVSVCADIKIAPNLKRITQDLQPGSWIEVKNCPSCTEVLRPVDKRKDALVVYYHGSINSERLPLCFLDSLKSISFPFVFEFAGYETIGSLGYIKYFIQTARANGLADKITYLGVLPRRKELLDRCSKAHVGLSLMPKTSNDTNMINMCGASNKPYDYLAAGCALLVSDLPEWNETYVKPGFGLSCDPSSAQSISKVLEQFYKNMDQTIDMGSRGREKILSGWNYETEFQPVLNIMKKRCGDEK